MPDIEAIDGDYSLDILLQLRGRQRDEAEQVYREAMQRHERMSQKVEQLREEHRQMVQRRKQICREFDNRLERGDQRLDQIRKFERYTSELRDLEEEMLLRIDRARKRHRRARQQMDQAHDEMVDAIRQLKAVESHCEQWEKQRDVEQRRHQARKFDELASRQWQGR